MEASDDRAIVNLMDQMIEMHRKKILKLAREIISYVTDDDILQPNDFPELENHPLFRYEEGVLEGMLSIRMAYMCWAKDKSSSKEFSE